MSPTDLQLIRRIHVARLDRARDIDTRGVRIGAPDSLLALGVFLQASGAVLTLSASERRFGLDHETYAGFANPLMYTGHRELGERFARAILADLRGGGDGMRVRQPSRFDNAQRLLREAA